ncbi:MAG: hypothetical protein K2P65_00440 [Lachnospiraceae bacterium]|nr:hypothetical protein [Lachnospiraceae bacterium]
MVALMKNKDLPDQLVLYRGCPHKITDEISIRIPSLEEICAYGESAYYSMVHMLCSVGVDLCWQLEEANIPFDQISDFELFYSILRCYFGTEQTKILFGEYLNLKEMKLRKNEKGEAYLEQKIATENDGYKTLTIDEHTYYEIVKYLRAFHNLKRNDAVAGTNSCRIAFIEDAKAEYEAAQNKPRTSYLLPLISTMVNHDGFKRNDQTIWDMNIFAFMDSVKRVDKIRNSNLLLQSGYSGFGIDLKKIKKEELNYMGALN